MSSFQLFNDRLVELRTDSAYCCFIGKGDTDPISVFRSILAVCFLLCTVDILQHLIIRDHNTNHIHNGAHIVADGEIGKNLPDTVFFSMDDKRFRLSGEPVYGRCNPAESDLVFFKVEMFRNYSELCAFKLRICVLRDEDSTGKLIQTVSAFNLCLGKQCVITHQIGDNQHLFSFGLFDLKAVFFGSFLYNYVQLFGRDMDCFIIVIQVCGQIEMLRIVRFHCVLYTAVEADCCRDHDEDTGGKDSNRGEPYGILLHAEKKAGNSRHMHGVVVVLPVLFQAFQHESCTGHEQAVRADDDEHYGSKEEEQDHQRAFDCQGNDISGPKRNDTEDQKQPPDSGFFFSRMLSG